MSKNLTYQIMRFGKKERRIDVIHLRKPVEKGLAGMVTSSLFPKSVAIVVDPRPIEDLEYEFMCLSRNNGDGSAAVWMETEAFYGIKRGNKLARMALFHELGHYYYRHLNRSAEEKEAYDRARVAAVEMGQVIQEELDADQFAVDYLGKDCVIAGLLELKTEISNRIDELNDEDTVAALKELDYRIMKLQS